MTHQNQAGMRQIAAVLFDLGDTLWHFPRLPDPEVWHARSVERMGAVLRGWGRTGVDVATLARAIQEADSRQTWEAYQTHCRSPHFPTLVREVAEAHDLWLTEAEADALWHAWNVGGAFLNRELFPDTLPTLATLRARGYRLGVVTNRSFGGPAFVEELRAHGLDGYFETLAISCDEGWLKPAPELFRKALGDLAVTPAEAMMVGDSLRADVAGAKALGMVAVWKRPPWFHPEHGHTVAPPSWRVRVQTPRPRPQPEEARLPDGSPATPDYVIDHPRELLDLPILH